MVDAGWIITTLYMVFELASSRHRAMEISQLIIARVFEVNRKCNMRELHGVSASRQDHFWYSPYRSSSKPDAYHQTPRMRHVKEGSRSELPAFLRLSYAAGHATGPAWVRHELCVPRVGLIMISQGRYCSIDLRW